MNLFRLSAACLALALSAAAEEKTYDLKALQPKAQVGQKAEYARKDTKKSTLKVKVGGKTVKNDAEESETTFKYVAEVLEVEDRKPSKQRITFSKAMKDLGGENGPAWSFVGKALLVSRDKDGIFHCEREDGEEMSEEDIAGVLEGLDEKKEKKKDKLSGEDLFLPDKPVKVGESWKPDMEAMAKDFAGGDDDEFDMDESHCEFTLDSVETVDGVDFARVKGHMHFVTSKMKGMELDPPLPMDFDIDATTALGADSPDGGAEMSMVMKGNTKTKSKDGTVITLIMNIEAKMKGESKSVK